MGNYRLTRRGKIVLAVFIALILYVPFRLLSPSTEPSVVNQDPVESPIEEHVENSGHEVNSDIIESPEQVSKETFKYSDEESFILSQKIIFYFKPDSDQMIEESLKTIEKFPIFDEYLVIEGHINGHPDYNDTPFGLDLAERRAIAVKDMVVAKGMHEERIIIRNHGSHYPLNNDSTESELTKNRRVTIYYKDYYFEE